MSALLTASYNANIDFQGHLVDPGRLAVCLDDREACSSPDCIAVLDALVADAGCCAPALPALLQARLRLPCKQ